MKTKHSRIRISVLWAVAILGLAPAMLYAWATITSPANVTQAERDRAKKMIDNAGTANTKATFWGEFDARRGPHPIHQFIAWQAMMLVTDDPAFKDSGFPEVEEINRWDGQFRGPHGPTERTVERQAGEWNHANLIPTAYAESSPGPDAEGTRAGGWNPFYNGRAHYWNPWLRSGGAPDEAGGLYVQLVDAMHNPSATMRDKARLACYMAHYIGDVASLKHADAFAVPDEFMEELKGIAQRFVAARSEDPFAWVAHQSVTDAENLFRRITAATPGAASSPPYWTRVEQHIADHGLLVSGNGYFVNVVPKTIRSSVAAYLNYLGTRPGDKSDSFFNYFDPFYFNGEIVDVDAPTAGWGATEVLFDLCTPASEHLNYESNPAQTAYVRANADKRMVPGMPMGPELLFRATPDFFSQGDGGRVRQRAMVGAMGALVRSCSERSHGQITENFDFDHTRFEDNWRIAIRHVASAFRACITGLRIDARLIDAGMGDIPGQKRGVRCRFKNVATRASKLQKAVLTWDPKDAKVSVTPAADFNFGGQALQPNQVVSHTWEVQVPEGQAMPAFKVDLYGLYEEVPDSGWAQAKVIPGGVSVVYGAGAAGEKIGAGGVPVDLVVVFDTTGSMQPSIDSVKKRTEEVIYQIHEKCPDLRVGLVEFRDLQDKGAPPMQSWDFEEWSKQVYRIREFKAKGGGDTPEDQYAGIMRGIKMKWRNTDGLGTPVTKLIVVVTDAEAKKPDIYGNTAAKVAKAAFDLDPAHIYPIVVGSSSAAMADAEELAKLTDGKVLSAASGEEVASKMLEAVEEGIAKHAPPPPPPAPKEAPQASPWLWILGGSVLSLAGAGLLMGGLASKATGSSTSGDSAACHSCGAAAPAGKRFCTSCGAPLAQ